MFRPVCAGRSLISIHALREEGDLRAGQSGVFDLLFQSTPSARRATTSPLVLDTMMHGFQSTPSARRATGARR